MLSWIFGDRSEREAKQLNRDAPIILKQAEEMFSDSSLTVVADLVREHIKRAHNIFGTQDIDYRRALQDYRRLHKDARSRTNQRELSAMTLVIIYLRSELTGPAAAPARERINHFISTFAGKPPPAAP